MREIMFRGKRIDNGKWVEGYLYITHTGTCEIGCYNAETNIERWTSDVDPATVGQYTGLKDKNGKRIFEGDIARFTWENYFLSSPGGYFMHPSGTVFEVRCLESGYMLCKAGDNALEPNSNGKVANYDFWNFHRGLEVIGNIHDNKSLLNNQEAGE